MRRPEWRVLFHLGRYGALTAPEIGRRAKMHKTRTSRAVRAFSGRRFLGRQRLEQDRRHEMLRLPAGGHAAHRGLRGVAEVHNTRLRSQFSAAERAVLLDWLLRLSKLRAS